MSTNEHVSTFTHADNVSDVTPIELRFMTLWELEFLGTILQDDRLRRRPASAGPQDDRLRRRPASVIAFSFRSFSFFQGFSVEFYRYF